MLGFSVHTKHCIHWNRVLQVTPPPAPVSSSTFPLWNESPTSTKFTTARSATFGSGNVHPVLGQRWWSLHDMKDAVNVLYGTFMAPKTSETLIPLVLKSSGLGSK